MKQLTNTRTKKVIGEMQECTTPWSRARGLMFSRQKPLLFTYKQEKKRPLHMFFVFFPIKVLFLNKKKEVVEIKEHFKPFTFYKSTVPCTYFVELPKKEQDKCKDVKKRDILAW